MSIRTTQPVSEPTGAPRRPSFFGRVVQWIDRWIPTEVLADSIDLRQRARVLFFCVTLTLIVALLVSAKDATFGNPLRAIFCLAVTLPLALTLGVLRATRNVAWSSHYFLFVILAALYVRPMLDPHGSQLVIAVCATGLIAAHQISARAGAAWTFIAIGIAAFYAMRLSVQGSPDAEASWSVAILTGAIGFMSVASEHTRRVAIEMVDAANERADEGRDRLRILAERAFPGLIEVSPGRIDYASPGVYELLGYSAEEFSSKPLKAYVHPDDFRPVVEQLHAEPRRVAQVEARLCHARGHWAWIAAFAIPYPKHPSDDRWIFAARNVERERSERERGVQAARLEGVGLLAAGVAHDFNNLLTVIAGNADLLPSSAERDEIQQTTAEAAGLTRQLLAFGKEQPHELHNLDLRDLVDELAPILRSLLGEEITMRIDADSKPCPVRGDPAQLNQVILNLVTNARDAMSGGGSLEIEISQGSLSAREASDCGLSAEHVVRLAVRDDGTGMDTATLTHAFDPFFTTKTGGRGSGLGLASAYGIARQSGGHLQLESAPGEGTRATLRLPGVSHIDPPVRPHARPLRKAIRGGRVLVVEDDPRIRALVRDALRGVGFDTFEAGDGAEALRMFSEADAPPVLLVTDVVMPGMRGSVVAEQMRRKLPNLKVLFISGYSDQELGPWQEHRDGVAFLAKPFSPAQLAERACELLARSSDS